MGNPGQSLKTLLPKCKDEQLLALLRHLLTLNPYERWSAAEALKSPIFDEIRNKNAEKSSKLKVQLDIDQDSAFDYGEGVSKIYSKKDYE